MIKVTNLNKAFGGLRAVTSSASRRAASDHLDHRAERRRQEHRVQPHRRHAAAGFRHGRAGRARRHRPAVLQLAAARRRALLPDHQPVLRSERIRERPARLPEPRRPQPLSRSAGPVAALPRRAPSEILEEFGLGDSADELVGNLSHGDQRRIEIAVCMALEPKLLMLDEPTQGMSPAETAEFDALIKSLAGRVTVLLIEHDIDLVMSLSDHVIVMHQGGKLFEGAPEQCAPARACAKPIWGSTMPLLEVEHAACALRLRADAAGRLLHRRRRRDRQHLRAQRCRQDHDAAHDHGLAAAVRGQHHVRRRGDRRVVAGSHLPPRHRLHPGGPPHLRDAERRGEPDARPVQPVAACPAAERRRHLDRVVRSVSAPGRAPPPARQDACRAASSRCSRSAAP